MERSAEKFEGKDCTSCPYLEFIVPLERDIPFALRSYRCQKKNVQFLNRDELKEAYKTCEEEKEIGVTTPVGSEIIEEILTINTLFRTLTGAKFNLFKEDVRITRDIMMPCKNGKDFRSKIGSLALVFDNKNLTELRKMLKGKERWKLIKIVDNWLKEEGVTYDLDMIQTWNNIVTMRNCSYPYHPESSEMTNLLRFFGHGASPDYPKLWDSILEKLLQSLRTFRSVLNSMTRRIS